jgi:putative sigma-54 modulation protein
MSFSITGRNFDVTPALREYTQEKIGRIEKYVDKITSVHVILTVEKYRHIAEVTIQTHGTLLKGVEETADMYSSVDKVLDKIEIQAKKLKERIKERSKTGHVVEMGEAAQDETPMGAKETPRILPGRAFNPRPMSPEEAALQLSLGTDVFLVFVNARTSRVNVLYRRSDGRLALIETA